MALNVRETVAALYRYLRKENRTIPFDQTLENPIHDALLAINGQLQEMALFSPVFAANKGKGALFPAPSTAAVSALSNGGTTCAMAAVTAAMLGCEIELPGDAEPNRIVSFSGTTVTLQFPHMSATTSGTATINYDACELPSDVLVVLEPVRIRGGNQLTPAGGRAGLGRISFVERNDFGRISVSTASGDNVYFIESAVTAGSSRPKLRMMLAAAPVAATVVEYQARCSLGSFTSADVHGAAPGYADPGVSIPAPYEFHESVFLPLVVARFFATPTMRDVTPPVFVKEAAASANRILERMRPQGNKPSRMYPVFR